jgi:hypothetical protein
VIGVNKIVVIQFRQISSCVRQCGKLNRSPSTWLRANGKSFEMIEKIPFMLRLEP